MSSLTSRLLQQATEPFNVPEAGAEADSEAMVAAGVAFRNIGQMVTALSVNEQGLSVMSKLHLEEPLAALLELPADDFRVTTLVILSSLARSKESCTAMIRSQRFMRVLTAVQITLQDPGSAVNQEELEYLVYWVDITKFVQERWGFVEDALKNRYTRLFDFNASGGFYCPEESAEEAPVVDRKSVV